MDDSQPALWHLSNIPLFTDLASEQLTHLGEHTEIRTLPRREVIYFPGDPGQTLFVVVSGRIKNSKVTRDGKALTLAYWGPSDLFGETCIGGGTPRQDMAETVDPSVVAAIDRVPFEELIAVTPSLGLKLTTLLAARRLELENKLETLVFRDVTSKLAELLLKLAADHGEQTPRGILIAVKITHQELANLIGSTRETVSLTLSQFKRNSILATEGRKMIILNKESMRALF